MNQGHRSTKNRLARKMMELSIAAPVVVAHRSRRMTKAFPHPSVSDRREFTGMVVEKQLAFVSSWAAMQSQCWKLQQSFAMQWISAMNVLQSPSAAAQSISTLQRSSLGSLSRIALAGITPVHRKAVANAKRLSRK